MKLRPGADGVFRVEAEQAHRLVSANLREAKPKAVSAATGHNGPRGTA